MKKLILILMLIAGVVGAATIQSTGGGSSAIVSGTTTITGGGDTQVCFNDAGTLACGDAGCVYNKTTNTLTCDTFAGALTGTASLATALAGGAADQVMVQTGAGAGTFRTLPASPQNGPTVTQSVIYDSNTDLFSAREQMPQPGRSRNWGMAVMVNQITGTTFVGFGSFATNATAVGTSSVYANDNTTFHRGYVTMTTKSGTPTSGDAAGYRWANVDYNLDLNPKGVFRIAMPATITTMRCWVGFANVSDISAISTSSTTGSSNRIVAFGYDTGGAADTTHWQFCTSDGTGGANTMSCADTGVVVTASHEYIMTIDASTNSALVYWRILDATTSTTTSNSKATTLPNPTTGTFGPNVIVTTLTGAQRSLWVSRIYMETN